MDKIWVSYLVPKMDLYLMVEDGLGFMAKGRTKEEAEQNLNLDFARCWEDETPAEMTAAWNEYQLFTVEL